MNIKKMLFIFLILISGVMRGVISAEKLGLESLGISRNASEKILGEAPPPRPSNNPKNIKMGVVCYDQLGRAYRSDNQDSAHNSRYNDCLESGPTQNHRQNEKNIEMKMGVDLPIK